jgi:hypothetical protein
MIWVEILARRREVAARFCCPGEEARIGRGYDNDVVVDDPYVAAQHVRVFRDESGRLVAEDNGSAGGMFLQRNKSRQDRILIDGDRPIRIGHTYLRIREPNHPVEPERTTRPWRRALPVAATTALGVLVLGIEALYLWLGQTSEPKASAYLLPLLGMALVVAVWAGVWALLSRIFSGRARFQRNLLIALSGLLVISLYNQTAEFSAFALTWRAAADHAYIAIWCILAAVCFFHLREVSNSKLVLKGCAVAAVFGLFIAVQTVQQFDVLQNSGRQKLTSRRLLPPALRLAPLRDEEAFFADVRGLKADLDRDRLLARSDEAGQ